MQATLAALAGIVRPSDVPEEIQRALQDDAYADAALAAAEQGGNERTMLLLIFGVGRSGGMSTPQVARLMNSGDAPTRLLAALVWWRLTGDEVRTLATLRRTAETDPDMVPLVLDFMGCMGAAARGEVAFVASMLGSDSVREALFALQRIGDESGQTLAAIEELAQHTDWDDSVPLFGSEGPQGEAIRALLHLGAQGRGAAMRLLASANGWVRAVVSEIMCEERVSIDMESFLEAIETSFAVSIEASCPAASCVLCYAPQMNEAQFLRALEAIVSGGSTCIVGFLDAARKDAGSVSRHYPTLARYLSRWSGDSSIRADALEAWVAVDPTQRDAADALLAEAKSEESARRSVAVRLLGRVRGAREDVAAAVLAKAVGDASPDVRAAAAEAMRFAPRFRADWLEGVRSLLEGGSAHVRRSAYEVVEAHAGAMNELVLEVTRSCASEVGEGRVAGARAAWAIGVDDAVVTGLLLAAWRDGAGEWGPGHQEVLGALREVRGLVGALAGLVAVLLEEPSTSREERAQLTLLLQK